MKAKQRKRYAYHGTKSRNLQEIRNSGLLPFESSRGAGVWFVETSEEAKRYGGSVLRFPWPRDAKIGAHGSRGEPYWFTSEMVEPDERLEILLDDGSWLPLHELPEEEATDWLRFSNPLERRSAR